MPRPSSTAPLAIWWLRRDLRLADNQALACALEHAERVLPVFVVDPHLVRGTHAGAARRLGFLWAALRALADELRARGSRLTIRTGEPARVLRALADETGATLVAAEGDVSPYGVRRDAAVAAVCPLVTTPGLTVQPPGSQRTSAGTTYTVFTPFRRAWLGGRLPVRTDLRSRPRGLATPPDVATETVPDGAAPAELPASEAEAERRLAHFADGAAAPIHRYDESRDRLDLEGTSALSPYLRFGLLSARRVAVAALAQGGADEPTSGPGVWLSELAWRDFYLAILHEHPAVLRQAFDPRLRRVRWRDDPAGLAAWREGRTGYPIVDAAMRQLAATGWLHNRARMIVASFLAKDLLVDWRAGERWFMRQLVDGDPAANNGGWQWTAGTGTDAAPYFRVFNPVRQAARCDPDGDYVRRWIPELRGIAGRRVHEPWRLTPRELAAAGVRLGDSYPERIVEHGAARARALAAYAAARAGAA